MTDSKRRSAESKEQQILDSSDKSKHQLLAWHAAQSSPKDVNVILTLRERVSALYPGFNWHETNLWNLRGITKEFPAAWSKSHDDLIHDLSKDTRIFNRHYAVGVEMSVICSYLLSMLYGKDRVGEAIQKFLSGNFDRYFVWQIAEVVERWDEFYEYPIEWAVNTLDD